MADDTPSDRRSSPPSDHPAPPEIPDLVAWERFLAGDGSAAEDADVRRWAASVTGSGLTADEMRADAHAELADSAPSPGFDPEVFLRRLENRLAIRGSPGWPSRSMGASPRRTAIAAWIAGAAAAGIVMLVAVGSSRGVNADRSLRLGLQDTGTFRTGRGERLRLRLPEGTEVALAPGSAVRVGAPTERYRRDLYVSGEAFFDVSGDPARLLTVHAANAVMRDAGARFGVHTDTGAGEVRVVVASGVLMLGDSGRSWGTARILTRGALGVVSSSGGTRARRARNSSDAMVWEAGAARFDPDRIRDALPGRPA